MSPSLLSRILRSLTRRVLLSALRVTVEGEENIPPSGAFIMVWNHFHISDAMLLFALVPARVAFIATDKFRKRNPVIHYYMKGAGAILVDQTRADHRALRVALAQLRNAGPLALAPEGSVSTTGALGQAKGGVALLARHSGAPILPAAVWGQWKAHRQWLRLQRPQVTVRFGIPQQVVSGPRDSTPLPAITATIMHALAQELPAQYRGFYADPPPGAPICG